MHARLRRHAFRLLAPAAVAALACGAALAQAPQQCWLAGRYDATRVVIVFDAVHYGINPPAGSRPLPPAVAPNFQGLGAFFSLPAETAAEYMRQPGQERFAPGDIYDLLAGNGTQAVKIDSYVGWQFDEGVGNDSYLGALATIQPRFTGDNLVNVPHQMFVVRRHEPQAKPESGSEVAGILPGPAAFAVQSAIAALLQRQVRLELAAPERSQIERDRTQAAMGAALRAGRGRLRFDVATLRLASGGVRYFARAEWDLPPGTVPHRQVAITLSAWISPEPELHILNVTLGGNVYDTGIDGTDTLLNAVDLGGGRTGVIMVRPGEDGFSVALCIYRDAGTMLQLASFGSGE